MQHQLSGIEADSIVARNRAVKGSAGVSTPVYQTPATYSSVYNLRAALLGGGNPYYTDAVLDKMSINDMVYAVRVVSDPQTI